MNTNEENGNMQSGFVFFSISLLVEGFNSLTYSSLINKFSLCSSENVIKILKNLKGG